MTLDSTASSTTQVGQSYSQTNMGAGGTTPFTYSVSPGTPAGTTLNASTGLVSGTPTTAGAFSYTITVTDSSTPTAKTASNVVSGTIAPATLILTSTPSSTTQVGQPYSQTNMASGGTTPFTYSVSSGALPSGTTLNAATGLVSGTPTTTGAFSYAIEVADHGNPVQTATQTVSGTIVPTLIMTSTGAATTQVGKYYRQTNVASGGTAPYTYSVSAGALPAGTSLDASKGTVSGTPTTTGAFSYTIEVTDSTAPIAQATTQTTNGAIVTTLTLAATASLTTQVGQPYSQANVASGGTALYTYSVPVGILPAGTTLNASTGLVSGTPTTAGRFSYQIKVTDSSSPMQTATQTSSGTITPATLTLVTTASSNTQVGQFYRQTSTASGGTTPYAYSVSAGTLPAGLSLNASTGAVFGTPTAAGAFSYTIKATDSASPTPQTATQVVSGTMTPATLTLVVTASNTTQVGQFYRQTSAASGGTSPYTYSVSAGTVPAGTTLNAANGTVYGTPTTAGAFSYTIKVTDSSSPTAQTATKVVSGTIAGSTSPTVTAIFPAIGPVSGGTDVYVNGANFNAVTAVSFGGVPASFTVFNPTTLLAISPAGAGTVDLTVTTTLGGVSGTSAADRFTYSAIPTVTSVAPNGGPPAGGTTVTITGTNFTGATAVNFGGAAAAGFTVDSATMITATSPAGSAATINVTVTTPNGTSAISAGDLFTYASPTSSQQGSKLVGSGASGGAEQGHAVALSSDGNTALVGGPLDNAEIGAAWIFTRSGSVWTQVGGKLVGTGNVGIADQGWSVALSGDGNTAIIGGYQDHAGVGAAWVFTQSGGVWTQQGGKLTASDEAGAGAFGSSVALSSDGNTALIGGDADHNNVGAAWVFARNGGSWAQQGSKLTASDESGAGQFGSAVALSSSATTAIVGGNSDNGNTGAAWIFSQAGGVWSQAVPKLIGAGAVGAAEQGYAVALSADGNTAIIGGFGDNAYTGAAWVFSQSGGVWSEVGSKLAGADAIGAAQQGFAVALSGDGSTAALGGYQDSDFNGAVWLFSQTGGVWTPLGSKLAGSDNVGATEQGMAVALSSDGTTLLEGGPFDNGGAGAAWVFAADTMAGIRDFNGDGHSDILWRDGSGDAAVWLMNGGQVAQSASLGSVPSGLSIIGQHDFNGDGKADILWRDTGGNVSMWLMNGAAVASAAAVSNVPSNFGLFGTGDLNGDGKGDLLWRDANTGTVSVWFMNGATVVSTTSFGAVAGNWSILGDANGSILWRDSAGDIALWGVQKDQVTSSSGLGTVPSNFVVQGVGDFNGDGNIDILWRDTNTGALSIWFTNGKQVTSTAIVATVPSNWNIAQVGDYNGDGKSDILWLDSAGDLAVWLMNGSSVSSSVGIANVGTTWQVQNLNAD